MSSEAVGAQNAVWELAGKNAAPLVEKLSVVLVSGSDPDATASVALGLARHESSRRAVTVADIWGDLPEIEHLTSNDDPHGISDHLIFGVSLARLRTPADGSPTLQLIKSGTDDIAQESLLLADRWDSIFASYRNVGALLVLPSNIGTPGLAQLSKRADGTIVVGDTAAADSLSGVLLRIVPPKKPAEPRASTPNPHRLTPAMARIPAAPKPAHLSLWGSVQRWPMPIVLAIATLGVIVLLLISPAARSGGSAILGRLTNRPAAQPSVLSSPLPGEPPAPAILNPDEAPEASRYSVEIAVLNTRAGADMRLAELRDIPGSTIAPVISADGQPWYRVFAGAYRTRDAADSLQAELRSRAIQMADGDRIVELPLAVQLAIHPPNSEAAATIALQRYISLGIPAYLLAQTDGSLILYAGGFETMEQAAHFGELCTRHGIPPRLAYRTGR